MTVLVAGSLVLGANSGGSCRGVLTVRIGPLGNDFCVNLLDMSTHLISIDDAMGVLSRSCVVGSNSQLRPIIADIYAKDDGGMHYVDDFVRAWVKVINLDRFDLC